MLNAQFKKIVLHECTKEVYPKTQDAALGPRCPLNQYSGGNTRGNQNHIDFACQFDELLLNKSKLLLLKYKKQGDDDGDVHEAKAHGA
jgi:hypothetical protein